MKDSVPMPMTRDTSKQKNNHRYLQNIYYTLLNAYKENETGYGAIAIIGQSCLGSAAVMLLLMNDMEMALKMIFVFMVTICCMGFNASILAQLRSEKALNMLLLSVALSTLIIIAHLF